MVDPPTRILHVEDNPGDARLLRVALGGAGSAFEIEQAGSLGDALERLTARTWDAVLLDLGLPDSVGVEGVQRVHASAPGVPIVVLTGLDDEALGLTAVQAGADDYLVKSEVTPALGSVLRRTVRHAIERNRLLSRLEARERQQRAVADLGRTALGGIALGDLLSQAVEVTRQVLGVEYAKVLELSPDGATFLLREGAGWLPGRVGQAAVDATDRASQAGFTLTASAPVVVTDFATEQRFAAPPLLVEHGIASGISVTIRGKDRPFGVFGVHSRSPRRFTGDDAAFVQAVANLLAEAVARDAAEGELRLLWAAVAMLNDMVIITDASPQPRIVFVNRAFERRTGYVAAEVIGKSPGLLQGPGTDEATRRRIGAALESGAPVREELLNYTKAGEPFWIELDIVPLRDEGEVVTHWVSVQRDTTERRSTEEALRQAQKMDAVGRLASGVAHDFNNLLTVIMVESEIALSETSPVREMRDSLREIRHAGASAATLTRQLLAFARKQEVVPVVFELSGLVAETDKMVRRLIGEDIAVTVTAAPGAGRVRADRGQVEQVLVNLAVNARDAMPDGGRLAITTACVSVGADNALAHAGVPAGDYVMLEVRDTGTGMSEEVRAHLFEPFFTTKARDLGTGLGLATCFGIVRQYGGYIAVDSALRRGTAMRVYLPREGDADDGETRP